MLRSDHAKARQRNRCSQIVMNPWFERLALGMVLLNAVLGLERETSSRLDISGLDITGISQEALLDAIQLLIRENSEVEMALDVELNRHQLSFHFGSSPLFVVSHNLFCVFFLTELVIRAMAWKKRHRHVAVGVQVAATGELMHLSLL